eukprot:CAMPEP_0170539372 /NCGR_PEP_ID=MMETSP0209-20121228/103886_1 /TAXON_ID=665100 ORGANISM="Litonotus pictus, Strain P1" /NCGR_SAMPLE_ID=MMETSP0209 /ASSEMBLY_ACC=CAM_ASM_000301 /LENGTH=414 /DNA_ID=CAMNT_0010841277 /DNA_START=1799 /DNA_END=3040 /DNA_ORIENTATION=-
MSVKNESNIDTTQGNKEKALSMKEKMALKFKNKANKFKEANVQEVKDLEEKAKQLEEKEKASLVCSICLLHSEAKVEDGLCRLGLLTTNTPLYITRQKQFSPSNMSKDTYGFNSFISSCQHYVHYSCWDKSFFKHFVMTGQSNDFLFMCPLCKKLSNVLIPILSNEAAQSIDLAFNQFSLYNSIVSEEKVLLNAGSSSQGSKLSLPKISNNEEYKQKFDDLVKSIFPQNIAEGHLNLVDQVIEEDTKKKSTSNISNNMEEDDYESQVLDTENDPKASTEQKDAKFKQASINFMEKLMGKRVLFSDFTKGIDLIKKAIYNNLVKYLFSNIDAVLLLSSSEIALNNQIESISSNLRVYLLVMKYLISVNELPKDYLLVKLINIDSEILSSKGVQLEENSLRPLYESVFLCSLLFNW